MKLLMITSSETISTFTAGLWDVGAKMAGSATSLYIMNVLPPEQEIAKAASALTGWGLAVACIWTLAKVVKALYVKIDEERAEHKREMAEKDKIISDLHSSAVMKSEAQRQDMLNELKLMNERKRHDD